MFIVVTLNEMDERGQIDFNQMDLGLEPDSDDSDYEGVSFHPERKR